MASIRTSRMLFFIIISTIVFVTLVLQKASYHNRDYTCTECMNSTLGFQKLVVVSAGPSWRSKGLGEAALRTGLEVTIPEQPKWTEEEVDGFRGIPAKGNTSELGPGQSRCWLGHLNVFREILANGWSTALIMEDDNDWDVMIKDQMQLIEPMIRDLTIDRNRESDSPYGSAWDLLWLGHCGEHKLQTGSQAMVSRIDMSLPNSVMYRKNYGDYVYHPPQLRLAHRTIWPGCTFAYAVTAATAQKIYEAAHGGKDDIITTELRWWCHEGGLTCLSIVPELFHHHRSAGKTYSEIAAVEGWEDLAVPAPVEYTANIKYSARCNSNSLTLVSCNSERG